MKFFFIFTYILLFFLNYYIIKLEKERGNRMNITVLYHNEKWKQVNQKCINVI